MHRSILPALKSGLARFYRHGSRPGTAKEQVSALTERRRIERRRWGSDFRRRELRLDAAVQAAGLGTYDLDYRTGSNYWSSELKAIAGLPSDPGDVPLEDLERLLHPQDRERVMDKIDASLDPDGDGRLDDEYRLVRPDGSVRWVKVRGQTYFAENAHQRRVLGASGIVIDITDRKAIERVLREQSEELRLALRVGNSGTFQWDARTHEHRWCDEMLALYGLRREEFGGRDEDWLECLLPEDRDATMAAVERSLATGEYAADFRIQRRNDGKIRWMSGRGQVYFDAKGSPLFMVGINVDISASKLAEANREESRIRLAAVLDSLSEGVVIFDMDGQVLDMNPAARRILRYQTAEEARRRLPEFTETFDVRAMDDQSLPLEKWPIGRVIRGESFTEYDIILCRKDDGSKRVISHNGHPVRGPGGEVNLGVLTFVDVTERKSAEEQIRQLNADLESRVRERTAEMQRANEALLESNAELKHFAHATAHDLQTPLRSIAGFAQLLQHEVKELGSARIDAYAAKVIDNTKRLQSLIQEVLSYSRLETQGLPFEAVNLRGILDEVLASLDVLISETGSEISCGDLPTLPVDRTQIAQVLQNLIENGIKYNHSKPPRLSIGAELRGGEWIFSIADNGMGIDPRYHEKIFEIFRRLHTYHKVPGSGIGLALCRRIVERHGGRIWVESHPGQGSTFHFSLPAGKKLS